MEDKKLIVIDCDGVLYPKKELSTKDILEAVQKAFFKKGISWKNVNNVYDEFKMSASQKGLFNFLGVAAREFRLNVVELLKQIAEETDYSHITPNPKLLSQIQELQKKYEVCIYTNNTKYHLEKVHQQLFGCSVAEAGIPAFHIGTIQNKKGYCSKQSKEALWFLSKFFAVKPSNMIFFDDTISVLDSVRQKGASVLFINQDFNLSDAMDYIRQIYPTNRVICRHQRTPFDKVCKQDLFTQELY